jgi:hypothetical protein
MRKLTIIITFVCISSWVNAQFITNTGIIITNSANLATNGDWQNSGAIRNNGIIATTDSWTNTGTLDNNSTGGFILQYATSKSFSAGSNSARIGFIQKEGIGDAAVTGRLRIMDSLKILSGIIKMNTTADTLGISSNTLVSVSNGSFVDGPMARFGAGTFLFPLGSSGQYLPLKFYNSTAARVGAVIKSLPAGFAAGEAVQSLPAFPYAWQTVKTLTSDTASYVEIQMPNALASGITNPIVVRKVGGVNQLEGMGSRLVTSDSLSTAVRSYSKGLQGLFSIGNGFTGNLLGDSTELVALYNSTAGNSWTNRTNWRANTVGTWFGITEKGGRVTSVNMPNNNINGTVPPTIVNMSALKVLNIASNDVTSIPDFTVLPALTTLDVSGNNLDFGSLESNASLIGVNYVNQDSVADPLYIEIPVNTNFQLDIPVNGTSNEYQWKLNGVEIPGATSDTYDITSINRATMGDYVLEITNLLVPGLILTSSNQRVLATADIAGTLYENNDQAVTDGTMRLLKVTSTGSYDTTQVQAVSNNGAYLFDNVVLDDYLVNGFADTSVVAYNKALPTYFEKTIFWEEADTLVLEDNITGLDISSEFKPDPPTTGQGEITGAFFETTPDEGRIKARTRVSKAAVTVRRAEGSGRGKAEILTLIAHTFTDENGEFTFTKLDEAEYRLNIQLPGYPMDTNSYVTIPIVDNLFDRQVGVEAEVIEGKIEVRKLVITGWYEERHLFTAYPNPTVDFLFIKGKEHDRNLKFMLTDATGKLVEVPSDWDDMGQQWKLNIHGLQKGIYFLQVNKNGKTETAQIVIQ